MRYKMIKGKRIVVVMPACNAPQIARRLGISMEVHEFQFPGNPVRCRKPMALTEWQ